MDLKNLLKIMPQKFTKWRIQILGVITVVLLIGFLLAIAEWTMRWLRPDLIPSNKLTSGLPVLVWVKTNEIS